MTCSRVTGSFHGDSLNHSRRQPPAFEIETELTVHALDCRYRRRKSKLPFKDRPVGSESKLSTFSDGVRILWTIGNLLKQEKPLTTFVFIAALLMVLAAFLIYPVIVTYLETGLVPQIPDRDSRNGDRSVWLFIASRPA